MKRLHKRTIFVASAIVGTASVLGISSGIVYATQDTVSKQQIAQNIEQELEDRIFGTINLLPTNLSGTFDSTRMQSNANKLIDLKDELSIAREDFTAQVNTKLPIYGIINDILNVSNRFDSWEDFIKSAKAAIVAINAKDWTALEEALFDTDNNGSKRLLSPSYGVEREDIDGTKLLERAKENKVKAEARLKLAKTPAEKSRAQIKVDEATQAVKDVPNRIDYNTKNSFISFGEYVTKLEESKTGDDITIYVQTIVQALNMIVGTPITNTGTGLNYNLPNESDKPKNSIVYMLQYLEKNKITNANAREVLKAWKDSVLPAWNKRYQAIDQFYDDEHAPVSGSPIPSTSLFHNDSDNLDAFTKYDEAFSEDTKSSSVEGSLKTSIETYLDGHETSKHLDKPSERRITNWDFLRIFFGRGMEGRIDTSKVGSGVIVGGVHSFDKVLVDNNALNIDSGANIQAQWSAITDTIFNSDSTKFPTLLKETKSGVSTNVVKAKSLWDELINVDKIESTFKILKEKTDEYNSNANSISKDSFSIGIKLEDLKEIIATYKLENSWAIKINSVKDFEIDASSIKELEDSMVFKEGVLQPNPSLFNIYKGYIYPVNDKWTLRASDSIELKGITFKENSELDPFEDEKVTTTIFKPYIRINEDADNQVSIDILWDHITGQTKGGK